MKKSIVQFLMVMFLSGFSASILSHDTTHIHPLITARIAQLIQNLDSTGAYQAIYEPDPKVDSEINEAQLLYWGADFDPSEMARWQSGEKDYLSDDRVEKYLTTANIPLTNISLAAEPIKKTTITGVIYEDVPFTKVFNHFYQAESGQPLWPGDNSANTAMAYFNQAIEAMGGYSEDTKQEAFFLFGQALHHVEDMSSPAHIHNDPHLTIHEPEKDDFEGWFLPLQKQTTICGDNMQGCAYFNNAAITPVSNPWDDIWGSGISSSLVMKVHAGSSYHANLAFTV